MVPGQPLHPARHVHRVADDRELQVALLADISDHHRPVVDPDSEFYRHRAAGRPLCVPALDRLQHGASAAQGPAGVVLALFKGAEGRHHRVAGILVDRAAAGEDRRGHTPVEAAQHHDDPLRRRILGNAGEADDVDEEDGDLALLAGRQRRLALCQLVD